jgi:hypothetical protein
MSRGDFAIPDFCLLTPVDDRDECELAESFIDPGEKGRGKGNLVNLDANAH